MYQFSDKKVFVHTQEDFFESVKELYKIHVRHNPVYREYCKLLDLGQKEISDIRDITFLPISLFKTHIISLEGVTAQRIFESSGTTETIRSKHHIADETLYIKSFTRTFSQFYGNPNQYCILALLPSYLEQKNSSLVFMLKHLIELSEHKHSGFYLYNTEELFKVLSHLKSKKQKTFLLGVSFALLDFAEKFQIDFPELFIIETGGMKGRKKEIIRKELHELLKKSFPCSEIHSEYGMTELLTQAYCCNENGIFTSPDWMKLYARDLYAPSSFLENGQMGGINIIDLANWYSCPFIATDDIGVVYKDGSFEIAGRIDNAEIRGCNTMIL